MKGYVKCFIGLGGCVAGLLFASPQPTLVTQLQSELAQNHFVQQEQPHIGVVVESSSGRVLFEKNSEQLFMPASVQKLLTAVASLIWLGPTMKFATDLYVQGPIKQGVLSGSITIKFSGDPSFTTDNLSSLLASLSHADIHTIKGNINLDVTAYNAVPYPPGRIWDDLSYSYAAPIGAMILDQNKFLLHLVPATQIGMPPHLSYSLPPGVVTFTNHARTTSKDLKACSLSIYSNVNNQYTVLGCLDKHWGRQRRSLAIRDVSRYVVAQVKQVLKKQHIQLLGTVHLAALPHYSRLLAQYSSPPLAVLLQQLLKESDNLYTDSLVKKLGESYYHQAGGWQSGLRAIDRILTPAGLDFHRIIMTDGAGMSRYDLMTPQQLALLLHYVATKPSLFKIIWKALPVASVDGTLKMRLQQVAGARRVHAKTGTMSGVSSIAGYLMSRAHAPLVFVIMSNGFVAPVDSAERFEDQMVKLLLAQHFA